MDKVNIELEKLKCGDEKALENLYKIIHKKIFLCAYSIVKDKNLAEDILHEVFIRIKLKNFMYRKNTSGILWIYKITKNLSLDILKKKKRELLKDVLNSEEQDCALPIEEKFFIEYILEILNKKEREIVLLHIVYEFKHKEIAKIINMNYATVRWKYSRAINKIRSFYSSGKGNIDV